MAEIAKDPKCYKDLNQTIADELAKHQSLPVGDRFLKATTVAALQQYHVSLPAAVQAMITAEGNKILAISISDDAFDLLKMQSTFYLDTVNRKIKIGAYPASVRKYFLMDESSAVLPPMTTRTQLLAVTTDIKSGDVKLADMGLTPPQDFPASDNDTLRIDYEDKYADALTAVEAFEGAMQTAISMKSICQKLCQSVRQQVDVHYNEYPAPAKRDFMQLWGIKFASQKETTSVDILSIYADGSGITPGAEFRVGPKDTKATKKVPTPAKIGVKGKVDSHGALLLETTQTGNLFIVGTCPGCKDVAYPIKIVKGEDVSVTIHFVKLPPNP
ncbi:MAG: hypothetical protein WCH34_03610 [Bacteroidota bacterium]